MIRMMGRISWWRRKAFFVSCSFRQSQEKSRRKAGVRKPRRLLPMMADSARATWSFLLGDRGESSVHRPHDIVGLRTERTRDALGDVFCLAVWPRNRECLPTLGTRNDLFHDFLPATPLNECNRDLSTTEAFYGCGDTNAAAVSSRRLPLVSRKDTPAWLILHVSCHIPSNGWNHRIGKPEPAVVQADSRREVLCHTRN